MSKRGMQGFLACNLCCGGSCCCVAIVQCSSLVAILSSVAPLSIFKNCNVDLACPLTGTKVQVVDCLAASTWYDKYTRNLQAQNYGTPFTEDLNCPPIWLNCLYVSTANPYVIDVPGIFSFNITRPVQPNDPVVECEPQKEAIEAFDELGDFVTDAWPTIKTWAIIITILTCLLAMSCCANGFLAMAVERSIPAGGTAAPYSGVPITDATVVQPAIAAPYATPYSGVPMAGGTVVQPADANVSARLATLEDLKTKLLISEEEYQSKRADILGAGIA